MDAVAILFRGAKDVLAWTKPVTVLIEAMCSHSPGYETFASVVNNVSYCMMSRLSLKSRIIL